MTKMHKNRSHGKGWTIGARFLRKAPRVARQSWCKASWPPPSLPSFLLILCMEGRGEDGCKGGRYKPHLGQGPPRRRSKLRLINCGAAAILMLNFDKGASLDGWLWLWAGSGRGQHAQEHVERDHMYCLQPSTLPNPCRSTLRLDCRESILNLVSYSRYLRSEDRQSGGGRVSGDGRGRGLRTPFVRSEYWGRYKSAIECATARGVIGERDGLRRQKRTERGEGYSGELLCAVRQRARDQTEPTPKCPNPTRRHSLARSHFLEQLWIVEGKSSMAQKKKEKRRRRRR